jgi:hypothetical protein
MARPRSLSLGNIDVPILELEDYNETIEKVGGFVLLRTVLGGAKRQHNWAKHRVTISGGGPLPASLLEVDHNAMQVLKLAAPQSIQSPSNVIVIPAARRADVPLEAYAVMDVDDYLVEAVIATTIVDTVTINVVPGAVAYRVNYWPQFTVFVDPPSSDSNRRGADTQWTLNCEEV